MADWFNRGDGEGAGEGSNTRLLPLEAFVCENESSEVCVHVMTSGSCVIHTCREQP